MSDWEVVWEARDSGNFQAAMEALYQLMRQESLDWLTKNCRCSEDAQDILHDAFLRAWRGLPSVLDRSRLRSYVLSVTRYTLIDRYRLRGYAPHLEFAESMPDIRLDPEKQTCENEKMRRLVRNVHRSPDRELLTRALGGQDGRTICLAMNMSDAQYRNRRHRAITHLRLKLAA